MKIKLDENFPVRLVQALSELGHEVDTVPGERLGGTSDSRVWSSVQKNGLFLITQDLDFSDARRFMPGRHHGILLIKLRNPGRQTLFERIKTLFQSEEVERWKRCFVVVTENKIRIRSPRNKKELERHQ